MFTLAPDLWNDGPPLLDFMGSEGAPRVARQHLCQGGGGSTTGEGPDYSQYISEMTRVGHTGLDRSQSLYDWATKSGLDLSEIARSISGKAMETADKEQGTSDRLQGDWERIYKPVYEAQAADAMRMNADLPGYQEHQAGKYGADAAMAIDQGMKTQMRNMRAQGFSPSAVATGAIGTAAATGRALATTAASEQGREAAKNEARGVSKMATDSGQFIPGVAGQQAQLAAGNRGQAVAAPAQAISTTAGAQGAGLGYYNAAMPWMKEWGDTMKTKRNQDIQAASVNAENDSGGFMSTLLPLAGGIAGSMIAPGVGTYIGSAIGGAGAKAVGSGTIAAKGGRIPGRRYAAGGAIDTSAPMDDGNLVPPEASPSGGDVVDDVPAMVSEGEFVIPKRTVDWLGDKFFQKLIQKTDMEIEQDTTAAPEEGTSDGPNKFNGDMSPQGAIDMQPPMFRSEGARA